MKKLREKSFAQNGHHDDNKRVKYVHSFIGKKPSDFYDGGDVTQDHWDALLKDVTNVDHVVYEQHVYKVCLSQSKS